MLRASPRAQRPAFTLVELLVVIGIIALLISILLPALNRARSSANQVKCGANLRTIGQSIAIYAVNNKGALPIGYSDHYGPGGRAGAPDYTNWALLLLNTLDPRVGRTSSEAYGANGTLSANLSKTRSAFFCPEVPGVGLDQYEIGVVHYTSNPRLIPDIDQKENATTDPTDYRQGYRASKVKRSAEVAMIFDGSLINDPANPEIWKPQYGRPVANNMDQGAMGYGAWFYFDPTAATASTFTSGVTLNLVPTSISGTSSGIDKFNTDTPENIYNIRFRHLKNTSVNLLYADGHVGTASHKVKVAGQMSYGGTELKRETFYVNHQ